LGHAIEFEGGKGVIPAFRLEETREGFIFGDEQLGGRGRDGENIKGTTAFLAWSGQ
jgi:hypothetical protein